MYLVCGFPLLTSQLMVSLSLGNYASIANTQKSYLCVAEVERYIDTRNDNFNTITAETPLNLFDKAVSRNWFLTRTSGPFSLYPKQPKRSDTLCSQYMTSKINNFTTVQRAEPQ